MNTRLTLADVRAALSALIDSDNPNNPLFLSVLNEVRERMINSGKWKGNVLTTTFESSSGFITLPYDYASVLALTYDKCPCPVFTQFHQYTEQGPGELDIALKWTGILVDLGDGFVTQADIPAAGVVRVYSSAADDGDVVRIFGLDENGDVIYDSSGNEGENITLAAPFAVTTAQFTEVTGFQKPLTTNRVRLKSWDGTTETQIAEYQPNETRPSYQRYKTGVAEKAIRVICQRRFVPIYAETDWVIPGNLSALRAGVNSWLFENGSDMDSADQSMARAYNFLNDEAKAFRGGARATINTQNGGWWGQPVPFVN